MVNSNIHEHETRQINDLVVAIHRISNSLACFPATGIRFYNALPVTIKTVPRPRFKHIVQS